jgi:hypothetical protein
MLLTHAYAHLLVDMHLAVFAPAFTLSFHDSECSRKPPNAHSLGRYVQQQKMKKSDFDGWDSKKQTRFDSFFWAVEKKNIVENRHH